MNNLTNLAERMKEACGMCYLDTAAMSLLPEEVRQAVIDFHTRRQTKGPDFGAYWEEVEKLRLLVAERIHGHEEEILFLQNTSMAMNLAANALPLEKGDNVLISNREFPSNVYPWMNLESRGIEVRMVESPGGGFERKDFEAYCDENTKAISVSWVIAANGVVTDIEGLSALCQERGYFFVVDAIQGLGVLPLDVSRISVDILGAGFFKWLLGPDGLAFAYIRKDILPQLKIPYMGWAGMEEPFDYSSYRFAPAREARRFETGNMNFSAIYGAVKAMELTRGLEEEISLRTVALTAYLREHLHKIPGIRLLTPMQRESSGITLFTCERAEALYQLLRSRGFVVNYRGGIRISPFFYNTREQIDEFLDICDR
ncbi:MAG: aminotransferase class V-fold PLP-dependent enzyme [Lachnospiraceae bacterium]|nr:aminotransferase class V-fold PLP-dependent enzyme [Lachnospiraceae bacterium]